MPITCTDEHLGRSSSLHVAGNGWLITGSVVIITDFHCIRTRWSGTSFSLTAGSTTHATIVRRVVRTIHIGLNTPNGLHIIIGIVWPPTIASIAVRRVSALTCLCCGQWTVDTPILRADGIGLDLLYSSKSPAAAATALILHSSGVNAYDDSMYSSKVMKSCCSIIIMICTHHVPTCPVNKGLRGDSSLLLNSLSSFLFCRTIWTRCT